MASIVSVGQIRARPVGRTHDHGQNVDSARFDTKKKTLFASEQARSDVAQARADWLAERPLPVSGQGRLIFLDETWATTCMTPIWGRSPRGERCLGYAPFGHWHTTTFVCALSDQGLLAPLVLDGPINGPAFITWVEQGLVPELVVGDIVVMDNLSSHKVAAVQSGLQSYRTGLCQAQDLVAQHPGPHARGALEGHRFVAGSVWPR